MKHCAFLTLDQKGDFVIDDELAIQPLADLGWQVSVVSWRQTQVPWSDFDAVIIRSTWDYWDDVDAFLNVLEQIDTCTVLANSIKLVNWNLAKTYLREMEQQGIGIVPTLWSEVIEAGAIADFFDRLRSDEIVIKPVLGGNGIDTFRLMKTQGEAQCVALIPVFRNRAMRVQRFLPAVITEGEYSLFFFNGDFSHATLRVPAAGEFRSQEERGAKIIWVEPEANLLLRGHQAMATIKPAPLYARIDFVRDTDGDFLVMECELIEPSLYLRTDPQAPARFAQAVNNWFED